MSKDSVLLICAVLLLGLAGEAAGSYIVVDDFDSYANDSELWAVWDDYWDIDIGSIIFLETDPNFTRDGNSLGFDYDNANKKNLGSIIDADIADLAIGPDWTADGVKALVLYFYGQPGNSATVNDKMWFELEDASSNVGVAIYDGDPNDVQVEAWHEWNIDLATFDACGVSLTNIDKLHIGFGGSQGGQGKNPGGSGTVYIEDIRLYPTRCRPEASELVGDFTGDCNVLYDDLDVMAADWLIADGCVVISHRDGVLTMAGGEPNWTSGQIDGALGFDPNIKVDVNDPCLAGLTSMSITAWVKRGHLTAFTYAGIVYSIEDGKYTGLGVYSLGGAVYLCWSWNQSGSTAGGFDVPGGTWTFVAMVAEATGCTLYMKPDGGTLDSERDSRTLGPLEQFDENFFIGRGDEDSSFFRGAIDDVRIYTYALDVNEITYLATEGVDGNEPDPNCPAYHYKFDDGSGLVALDSGCGASVYYPPMSPANLTDPEPEGSRFVNFHDYGILADNWMAQDFWP